SGAPQQSNGDAHATAATALVGPQTPPTKEDDAPLTARKISLAWTPFALMSVFLMLTGIIRQMETPTKEKPATEGSGFVHIAGELYTNYNIAIPTLHKTVYRDPRLIEEGKDKPEGALFNFAWLTAPGTAVFLAVLASMALLRMDRRQIGRVLLRTGYQMKIPIPPIAFMLGLSYVTRSAVMDATLGYALAMSALL